MYLMCIRQTQGWEYDISEHIDRYTHIHTDILVGLIKLMREICLEIIQQKLLQNKSKNENWQV